MTIQPAAALMVGKISHEEVYRETLLLRGVLKASIECADAGHDFPDNGLYDLLQVAERMADQLSQKVSP